MCATIILGLRPRDQIFCILLRAYNVTCKPKKQSAVNKQANSLLFEGPMDPIYPNLIGRGLYLTYNFVIGQLK